MFDFTFQDIFIKLLCFIIAGSIHEFAHAWSAYKLKDFTAKYENRMTINPLSHIDPIGSILFPLLSIGIGWMRPVPISSNNFNNPTRDIAIVSFAGPFSNFIQACLTIPLIHFFDPNGFIANFLIHFSLLNILLMGFNLLPLSPLDGGYILRYFLPFHLKEYYDRFSQYSFMILLGIIFLPRFLNFPDIISFWLNPFKNIFFSIYSESNIFLIFLNIINAVIVIYFIYFSKKQNNLT